LLEGGGGDGAALEGGGDDGAAIDGGGGGRDGIALDGRGGSGGAGLDGGGGGAEATGEGSEEIGACVTSRALSGSVTVLVTPTLGTEKTDTVGPSVGVDFELPGPTMGSQALPIGPPS
jgi:hypothetical protein